MMEFYGWEEIGVDTPYIDPHTLSNEELEVAHAEYMESPHSVSWWREVDDEMNHRVEEGLMEWPY
jgi:hypothetical protein